MDPASRAVKLFESGEYDSLAAAGRAVFAPPSTVNDRHRGLLPWSQSTHPLARLCRYQERVLIQYIRDLQLQYAPINQAQLAVFAERLAQEREPGARLGKNWVYKFVKRHIDLSKGRNRPLTASWIEAAISDQIWGWYAHVEAVIHRYSIQPHDQWNMDEIGYQMSHSQKEMVVFNRAIGPPISIVSGSIG